MLATLLGDTRWLQALSESQPKVAELLSRTEEQQKHSGYFHTLREICQQPVTWLNTAQQMIAAAPKLREFTSGIRAVVLTGSGSSEFAGDCVRMGLRRELGITTAVVGGGTLLTCGEESLPPERPLLIISLARSGDSPESAGALSRLLTPDIRHLVLTCNERGRLAEAFKADPSVHVISLDDATNDRSLVMTSSFTNLVLAAGFLGCMRAVERYREISGKLSETGKDFLRTHLGALSAVAKSGFRRAIYLGTGAQFGVARESALKMLEMTAGSVATLCDSYLAFRHGPMSFAHSDTLFVCFLSCDPLLRAYESDLLAELNDKELGLMKVIVGENVPRKLAAKDDVILECPGLSQLSDDHVAVIHVMAGQLLAFFRCLEEGLRPDSPSEDGVINRVVQSFRLHLPARGEDESKQDGRAGV